MGTRPAQTIVKAPKLTSPKTIERNNIKRKVRVFKSSNID